MEPKLKRLWVGALVPAPVFSFLCFLCKEPYCWAASPSNSAGHLFSLMVPCTSALILSPSSVGGPAWNKPIGTRCPEGPLGTSPTFCICHFSFLSMSWVHSLLFTTTTSTSSFIPFQQLLSKTLGGEAGARWDVTGLRWLSLGQLQSPPGFLLSSLSLLHPHQSDLSSIIILPLLRPLSWPLEGWTNGLPKDILAMGSCCVAQGTTFSHLWWNMMEDNVRKSVYICVTGSLWCTVENWRNTKPTMMEK